MGIISKSALEKLIIPGMSKPLILIASDAFHEPGASRPREGVYASYVDAVLAAGGLPLIVPARAELLEEALALAAGLLLPGGDDVDPGHYGQENRGSETPFLDETRVVRDLAMLRRFFDEDRPLLGVCAGMQIMNIALGGTLTQDLDGRTAVHRKTSESAGSYKARHPLQVEAGSLLFRITGKSSFESNSSHHQALDRIADPLRVTARAPDGVVEAIEAPAKKFYLGVQWHPETEATPDAAALFAAFIAACAN